jgi:hypothetical protein
MAGKPSTFRGDAGIDPVRIDALSEKMDRMEVSGDALDELSSPVEVTPTELGTKPPAGSLVLPDPVLSKPQAIPAVDSSRGEPFKLNGIAAAESEPVTPITTPIKKVSQISQGVNSAGPSDGPSYSLHEIEKQEQDVKQLEDVVRKLQEEVMGLKKEREEVQEEREKFRKERDEYKRKCAKLEKANEQNERKLEEQERELQQKDRKLQQKDRELQQKDTELQQKNMELQQKHMELQQKDIKLQKLQEGKTFLGITVLVGTPF